MITEKRYRINFLAKSVDTLHPSAAAVAAAIENALRSIGLSPYGSSVESSKEVEQDAPEQEKKASVSEEFAAAERNIRALQEAASQIDGQS